MTDYAPRVSLNRRKRPARKCRESACPQLTRHRTGKCPDHRRGTGTSSAGSPGAPGGYW